MVDLNKPETIERAIALADVNAALQRYTVNARSSTDWKTKAQAFTPDAQLVLSANGAIIPVSQMEELVRGKEAEYYRHHVTAIDIRFSDERTAHTTSQVLVVTNLSTCDHWGEWQDTLVRSEDGAWFIKEKVIVVDGSDPKGWYTATYGQA